MSKLKHNWLKVILVLATISLFLVVVLLNFLASRKTIFPNDVASVSRKFRLDVTPAPWVFPIIWNIIFFWQGLWLIYALTTLFRRFQDQSLIYRRVDFFHYGIFVSFLLNNVGMIGWLIVWTNQLLSWSVVLLVLLTLALYAALGISCIKLYENFDKMKRNHILNDIWLVRALLQNGLATFATWTTLASCLNLATYLKYEMNFDLEQCNRFVLFLVASLSFAYFFVENFVWQKYFLYMFTPWLVLTFGLVGSLEKNLRKEMNTTTKLIASVLCFVVLLTIGKILIFYTYLKRCPHSIDKRQSHLLLQIKEEETRRHKNRN